MRILFAVDEAYPLYKIGGLGDVGGSLPKALHRLEEDIRIALPKHPEIILPSDFHILNQFQVSYHHLTLSITAWQGLLPHTQVPVYLFEEPQFLSQHTDASDNHADKFAVFSLIISHWLIHHTPDWQPQIIHFQDWHTALIPIILKYKYHSHQYKFLGTIHNLAYQGETDTPVLDRLEISPSKRQFLAKTEDTNSRYNILLEGLLQSDAFNTVSPTYAREILTDEYGEHINSYLIKHSHKLSGILNGIDTDVFNPTQDPHLFQRYDHQSYSSGKAANKSQLLTQLGLPSPSDIPLISFVGRVDPRQKGIQLIIDSLGQHAYADLNTNFIFLGSGDSELEKMLHQSGDDQPNCRIYTKYDEALAARIYAASDLVIIPSRFEPCGLVQMNAMRYGALPVARKTGGLADTISHQCDGFLFTEYKTSALINAIKHALLDIAQPQLKAAMITQAMVKDFSWSVPAQQYQHLYQHLIDTYQLCSLF